MVDKACSYNSRPAAGTACRKALDSSETETSEGEDMRVPAACAGRPDVHLMRLLLRHVGRQDAFAALFQPSPEQLPELLPHLVGAAGADAPERASAAEGHSGGGGDRLRGAASLLRQFPWDATAGVLSDEDILGVAAPQLVAFAALVGRGALEQQGAERDAEDAAELAMLPLQVNGHAHALSHWSCCNSMLLQELGDNT